jgi:hypothetical protein
MCCLHAGDMFVTCGCYVNDIWMTYGLHMKEIG